MSKGDRLQNAELVATDQQIELPQLYGAGIYGRVDIQKAHE